MEYSVSKYNSIIENREIGTCRNCIIPFLMMIPVVPLIQYKKSASNNLMLGDLMELI